MSTFDHSDGADRSAWRLAARTLEKRMYESSHDGALDHVQQPNPSLSALTRQQQ